MASNNVINYTMKCTADLSNVQTQIKKLSEIELDFSSKGNYKNTIKEFDSIAASIQNAFKTENLSSANVGKMFNNLRTGAENAKAEIQACKAQLEGLYLSRGNQKNLVDLVNVNKSLATVNKNIQQRDAKYGKNALKEVRTDLGVSSDAKERQKELNVLEKILKQEKELTKAQQTKYDNIVKYNALLTESHQVSKASLLAEKTSLEGEQKRLLSTTLLPAQYQSGMLDITRAEGTIGFTMQQINRESLTAASGFHKYGEELEETRKQTEKTKKETLSLGSAMTSSIMGFSLTNILTSSVKEAMSFYKSYDETLTRTMMVTNLNRKEVEGLTDSYRTMASELKTTTSEVASAQLVFYQQGLTAKASSDMTEASIAISKTGGLEAEESANRLTAAMRGYKLATSEAMDLADKMSALDAKAASSVDELTTAMQKSASQANMAGLDLDYYMAYLSTMQEVTRESAENIGTAMKSITARMQEITDIGAVEEDGTTYNSVAKALSSVGISAVDSAGQLRSLQDVMTELGPMWETLDRNQQAYIATTLAGNRQQSRFIALMDNYDRAMELVSVSQNAAGETAKQLRDYNSGLESSVIALKQAWETMATKMGETSFIKKLVDSITSIIELFNSNDLLIQVTKITAATVALKKAYDVSQIVKKTDIGQVLTKPLTSGIPQKSQEEKQEMAYRSISKNFAKMYKKDEKEAKNYQIEAAEKVEANRSKYEALKGDENSSTEAVLVAKKELDVSERILAAVEEVVSKEEEAKAKKEEAKLSKKEDSKAKGESQAETVKQNKKDIKAEQDAEKDDTPNEAEKKTADYAEKIAATTEKMLFSDEPAKLSTKDNKADIDLNPVKAPQSIPDTQSVLDGVLEKDYSRSNIAESIVKSKENELKTIGKINKANIVYGAKVTDNNKLQTKNNGLLKKGVEYIKGKVTAQGRLNDATAKVEGKSTGFSLAETESKINKVSQAALAATALGASVTTGLKLAIGEFGKLGDGYSVGAEHFNDTVADTAGLATGVAYFAKQMNANVKATGYLAAAVVTVKAGIYAWGKAAKEAEIAIERAGEATDNWSAATEQVTVMETLLDTYDSLAGKINKTTEEQEALNNAVAELAELAPEAIIGYDSDGNAILDDAKLEIVLDEKKSEDNEAAIESLQASAISAKKIAESESTTTGEKVAETATVVTAALAGTAAGAKAGAALGTAMAPGIGTAIGAVVGSVVGAAAGLIATNVSDSLQQTQAEYQAFILEMSKISADVVKAVGEQNEYAISIGSEENQQARSALASNLIHSSYEGFVTSGRVSQNMSDSELEDAIAEFNEEMEAAFDKISLSGGLDVLLAQVDLVSEKLMTGDTWSSVSEDFKEKLGGMLESMDVPDEYIESFVSGMITQIFSGMTNPETLKKEIETLKANAEAQGPSDLAELYRSASQNIDMSTQGTLNAMSAAGLYDNLDDKEALEVLAEIIKSLIDINQAGVNADGTLNQTGSSFALAVTILDAMNTSTEYGTEAWDYYNDALNNVINTLDGPVVESFGEMANTVSSAVTNVHSLLDVMSDLGESTQIDVSNFTTVLNIIDEMQGHMEDGLITAGEYSAALASMVDGTSVIDGALNMEADALLALAEIERQVFVAKMEIQKAEISAALEQARFEKAIIDAQIDALIEGLAYQGEIKEAEAKMQEVFNEAMEGYNSEWINNEAVAAANYVAITEAAVAQAGSAWAKLQKALASGDFSEVEGLGTSAENVLSNLTSNLASSSFNFSDSYTDGDDWNDAVKAQIAALQKLSEAKDDEISGLESQYALYEMLIEVGGDLSGLDAFSGSTDSASEYNEVLEETLTLLEKISGLMHTMDENSSFMSLYEGYDGEAYGRLLASNLALAQEQYEVYEALFEMQQKHVNQAAGDLLDSSYGFMFNIDENGDIGWSTTEMYDLYKSMSDTAQEEIDDLVQAFQEQRDELRSTETDMIAYAEAVKSAREELVAMELEVENALVEAIKNREKILYDARMKAIDDEVAAIEEAMKARTAAREDEDSEKELYEAQEALRRATLDSSGKNNAALLQLQEDLESKQLEISEKRFEDDMDERLEWLQDTKDAETETYEYRLETMTWYWEQVSALQEAGNEAMILALITWNEEYRTASALHQSEMEREWTYTMDAMKAATDMGLELGQLTDEIVSTTATIESMNIKVEALAGSWSSAASAISSATSALNSYNSASSSVSSSSNTSGTDDLTVGEKDDITIAAATGSVLASLGTPVADLTTYSGYYLDSPNDPQSLSNKVIKETVVLDNLLSDGMSKKYSGESIPTYKLKGEGYVAVPNSNLVYNKYKEGGMVDYTGPAWVDGTPSKPEAFLNPYQTEQIGALANALDSSTINSASSSNSITFENITFEVGSMSSPEDGKSALDAFVQGANDLMSKKGVGTTLNLNLK